MHAKERTETKFYDTPDESVDSLLGLLNEGRSKSRAYKLIAPLGSILNFVVFFLLIAAITICLIVFVVLPKRTTSPTESPELSICYISPACPANNHVPNDPITGLTYNTGWSSDPDTKNDCCSICLKDSKVVNCFNSSDLACYNKTGNGDYDYLMLDQMWLPQFCSALEQGHDFTLTHLPGTACLPGVEMMWASNLSIHGLWPNYYSGYPQCCPKPTETVPLHPSQVATWDIWDDMKVQWLDPTVSCQNNCSVCSMWNHEWQKHGTCFSSSYSSSSQEDYFKVSLNISFSLQTTSNIVNGLGGKTIESSAIAGLYKKRVNIICDPNDIDATSIEDTGIFSEIQSCWKNTVGNLEMVDCAAAKPATFTAPCPKFVTLRL